MIAIKPLTILHKVGSGGRQTFFTYIDQTDGMRCIASFPGHFTTQQCIQAIEINRKAATRDL